MRALHSFLYSRSRGKTSVHLGGREVQREGVVLKFEGRIEVGHRHEDGAEEKRDRTPGHQ